MEGLLFLGALLAVGIVVLKTLTGERRKGAAPVNGPETILLHGKLPRPGLREASPRRRSF